MEQHASATARAAHLTWWAVRSTLRTVDGGDHGYPRQSLGWAFQRVTQTWGLPEGRLARHLAVSPSRLEKLAACLLPPVSSPEFDERLDLVATTFGISRWRLDFICRAALLDPPRLRG